MSAIVGHDSAHAHRRRAFEQSLCHDGICLGDASERPRDCKDAIVHALHHLAHTSLDPSFFAKICNVFARLADDDSRLPGRDDGS